MKRYLALSTIILMLLTAAACGNSGSTGGTSSTKPGTSSFAPSSTQSTVTEITPSTSQSGVSPIPSAQPGSTAVHSDAEVLRSEEDDLDNDGKKEKIEILRQEAGTADELGNREETGILRVVSESGTKEMEFNQRTGEPAGVYSDLMTRDIDGDGVRDVFVIIPEAANPFTLNYFFIYNPVNGKSFTYSIDNTLVSFAQGFSFLYKGNGSLEMKNEELKFSCDLKLSNEAAKSKEETERYKLSWVDPSSVEIDENARLSLVPVQGGGCDIRVVLPIYGVATSNLIGEVDVFYGVDKSFQPFMDRFEVYGFGGGDRKKAGEGSF